MKQGQVVKITSTTKLPGGKDFQGSGVEGTKTA